MQKMSPLIFTGTVFGLLQSFGLDLTTWLGEYSAGLHVGVDCRKESNRKKNNGKKVTGKKVTGKKVTGKKVTVGK